MKTAVEWLIDQLEFDESVSMDNIEEIFNQAKAMEKEQMENAHIDGGKNQRTAVKYYNETFKSE